MESTRGYRELEAWKQAVELAPAVYGLIRKLPSEEKFGMGGQMRRACVSVAANIAEGHGRSSAEFLRYLRISRGSLAELDTIFVMAEKVGYLQEFDIQEVHEKIIVIRKLLQGLIRSCDATASS